MDHHKEPSTSAPRLQSALLPVALIVWVLAICACIALAVGGPIFLADKTIPVHAALAGGVLLAAAAIALIGALAAAWFGILDGWIRARTLPFMICIAYLAAFALLCVALRRY
jgi:hypothetical protein